MAQNYITKYYPFINKAEQNITNNLYINALANYDTAFSNVRTYFAKDLYNALVCAIKVKKFYKAKKIALQLSKKGVLLETLKKNHLVNNFLTENKLISKYITYLLNKKFNTTLINVLENILIKDQCAHNDSCLIMQKKTRFIIDSVNATSLKDIILKDGFPDENEIGYDGLLPSEKLYTLVMLHQHGMNKAVDFEEILFKAVQDGKLLPNTAMLISYLHSDIDQLGFEYSIQNYTFNQLSIKTENKHKEKINNNRAKWGIDTINYYRAKIMFSEKEKYFEFNNKCL